MKPPPAAAVLCVHLAARGFSDQICNSRKTKRFDNQKIKILNFGALSKNGNNISIIFNDWRRTRNGTYLAVADACVNFIGDFESRREFGNSWSGLDDCRKDAISGASPVVKRQRKILSVFRLRAKIPLARASVYADPKRWLHTIMLELIKILLSRLHNHIRHQTMLQAQWLGLPDDFCGILSSACLADH